MTTSVLTCAACGDRLAPGSALEIVSITTGVARYVHRPGVALRPGLPLGSCFRGEVGPHWGDRVRLADAAAAWAHDRAAR